jgi:hypothetical protein
MTREGPHFTMSHDTTIFQINVTVNMTEAGVNFSLYEEELTKMEIIFPSWRKAYQTDNHMLKIREQLARLEIFFPSWRILHKIDNYMFELETRLPNYRISSQSSSIITRFLNVANFSSAKLILKKKYYPFVKLSV